VPFVAYFNNQSKGIQLDTPPRARRGVAIPDCEFTDHAGFPVHAPGGALRVHMIRNTYRNCANGESVNADYAVHYRNRFVKTESLEAGGAFGIFARNDLCKSGTKGAVHSLGGDASRGVRRPGSLVIGNSIRDVPALGIITAERFAARRCREMPLTVPGIPPFRSAPPQRLSTIALVSSTMCARGPDFQLAMDTLDAGNTCTVDFYAFLCSSARAGDRQHIFGEREGWRVQRGRWCSLQRKFLRQQSLRSARQRRVFPSDATFWRGHRDAWFDRSTDGDDSDQELVITTCGKARRGGHS